MRLNNIYILLIFLTLCVAIPPSQAALTPLEISQQEEEEGVPLPQEAWFKRLEGYRKDIDEEYGTNFAFLFNGIKPVANCDQFILRSFNETEEVFGFYSLPIAFLRQ